MTVAAPKMLSIATNPIQQPSNVSVLRPKRQGKGMKTAPTAKGICAAKAYLDACAVPYENSKVGASFAVQMKSGALLEVLVGVDFDTATPSFKCLIVLECDLISAHQPTAIAAFHAITDMAGYDKPSPVDRGVEPDSKTFYHDDFELVAFRHRDLRKAPNNDQKLKRYERVIDSTTKSFFSKFSPLCNAHGYKVEDLKTFAQVWTLSHLHKCEIGKTNAENDSLLAKQLGQRYGEFFLLLQKKGRNTLARTDTLAAMFDLDISAMVADQSSGEEGTRPLREAVAPSPLDPELPEYDENRCEIDRTNYRKRKESAAGLLNRSLSALPHDKLVAVLTEAADNDFYCYDTQQEALRQIKKHRDSCSSCKMDEKLASMNPSSDEE